MDALPSSPPRTPPDLSDGELMDDIQDLPTLPNATIPTATRFSFQSTDPLNLLPEPQLPALGRKRAANSPALGPRKLYRNQTQGTTQGYTPQMAILEARDLIVLASTITTSRDEQTRLLDLLAIFREYTEKGSFFKASNIITS